MNFFESIRISNRFSIWLLALPGLMLFTSAGASILPGTLFGDEELVSPALSADGRQLALIDPQRGLVVGPVAIAQRRAARPTAGVVRQLLWFDERRLLVRRRHGNRFNWSLYDIDHDRYRSLIEWPSEVGLGVELLQIQSRQQRLLVSFDRDRPFTPEVFALDLHGRLTPVQRNPGDVVRWIAGPDGQVRLAQSWHLQGNEPVYGLRYRAPRSRSWQAVAEHRLSVPEIRPVGLAANGGVYLAQANGLRLWHPRGSTPLFARQLPEPVSNLSWGRRGLAMVTMQGLRPRQLVMDSEWRRRLDRLQARAPGTSVNLLGSGGDYSLWLANGDREPGLALLHDERTGQVTEVVRALPSLDRQQLVTMQPVEIDNALGLPLSGYLTRPSRAAPASAGHPVVVLVHGGPWSRDYWGFDAEVQYLASQGYAVLQVNFRGSRGLEHELMLAGHQQLGRGMQDDLLTALSWAGARYGLDLERVCIMGASYGGYAALTGVLRDPDTFRCAVAFAPLTDLPAQLSSIRRSGNLRGYAEWRYMMGEPEALAELSPLAHAQRLSRPVLLIHGSDDRIVSIRHSERFNQFAPEKSRLVRLDGVGHGLPLPAQRIAYYRRVAEFLSQHLNR